MALKTATPSLADLPFEPYLAPDGTLPTALQRQIGIYAIFDSDQQLQYIGYSRDVYQSLKQHLVRKPNCCQWYKLQVIERPSRSILETLKQAWTEEHSSFTPSAAVEAEWTAAIDAKAQMTAAEQAEYAALSEAEQPKYLKKLSRRLEAEILTALEARGVTLELRFNPKLKEAGLLDLK